VSNQIRQCDNMTLKYQPVMVPCWWVFSFIVSFVLFASVLLFFGGEALAKSEGSSSLTSGGGDSGKGGGSGKGDSGKGGGPAGGLNSGGGGGGDSGKGGDFGKGDSGKGGGPAGGLTSGGGHSAKGDESSKGGGSPINSTFDDGKGQASRDVSDNATGPLRDFAKNDIGPSSEGVASLADKNTKPALETVGRVADKAGQGIEDATKPIKPVIDSVATSAEPLIQEASPLVKPVKELTDPLVTPIEKTVAPIGKATSPILDPASEVIEPVVTPIGETVAPVVGAVSEPIGEVAKPVSELAQLPALGPLDRATSPVLEPLGQPATVSPMTEAAGPVLDPVVAGGATPLLEDGSQLPLSQTVESPVHQAALPATTMAASASAMLASDAIPATQEGNLEASASTVMVVEKQAATKTGTLSDPYSKQVDLSFFEKMLLSLNLAGVKGVQDQMPQSFPDGAMPAAGSLSGGSSLSSSSGGPEAGILGLLAVLLLGGKLLWTARDFLKPNAALRLAIERPG
jgi:hypothetical protein